MMLSSAIFALDRGGSNNFGGLTHKRNLKIYITKHKHIKFKLVKKYQTPMQCCIHWFYGFLTFCPKSGFITLTWNYFNRGTALITTFGIWRTKPFLIHDLGAQSSSSNFILIKITGGHVRIKLYNQR